MGVEGYRLIVVVESELKAVGARKKGGEIKRWEDKKGGGAKPA